MGARSIREHSFYKDYPCGWSKDEETVNNNEDDNMIHDSNVRQVINKMAQRTEKGLKEYGVTTERTDYSDSDWLNELQDELLDASIYTEVLKKRVSSMSMLSSFEDSVKRTSKSNPTKEVDGQELDLLHFTLGVSGEAGELVDAVKKHMFYNQKLDTENVKEELGDLMFYIVAICQTLNVSLSEIMKDNVSKLKTRYPDGYSDEHAKTRFDKKLDAYLEQ